jgi:archaellum biogenesis protein FlaJ (TadC family)
MTDFTDADQQEKLESYLTVHLKKDELSLSPMEQVEVLHKKKRNKWIQLAVNIAAILFFGYSFYFDITQLSQTFFIIIAGVFLVNVGLIFYQKNQIDQLVEYLHWKEQHES